MADTFKSKTVAIGATSTELLAAVTSGTTIVESVVIGNVDGSNSATFDLSLNHAGGGDVTVMTGITVDAGQAVNVFGGNIGKLYLADGGTPDTLDATASAASDLVATISYIERT